MATLTYDPTPADQPEFSEEEQDSIAVGEQLEQQQNQLLAGKYENAEQLEKAYVELQRKLGEQPQDEEPNVPEETSNETQEEEETEEVEEEQPEEEPAKVSISKADIDAIYNMVGGKEAYSNMIAWAGETMTKQEIAMFDHVMDLDNPWAAFFAVKAVQNAYENTVGKEGKMLTGKGTPNTKDVFRSQAEVIQAMSDPRYESDPAYRNDVFQKLDRSEIQF